MIENTLKKTIPRKNEEMGEGGANAPSMKKTSILNLQLFYFLEIFAI
jgi:hypothetical protein